jgi:hypothetical protein
VGSLNMAETTAISIGQIADIILISSTFPHWFWTFETTLLET